MNSISNHKFVKPARLNHSVFSPSGARLTALLSFAVISSLGFFGASRSAFAQGANPSWSKFTYLTTSMQTTLNLNPTPLSNVYMSPNSIVGGLGTRGVVQIGGKAGPSGDVVALQMSSTDASAPATVTIPAGTGGVSFAITSVPVSSSEQITMTATLNTSSLQTTLTLNPTPLAHFYTSAASITGGTSTHGVVQLAGPAAPGGDLISLVSSNPDAIIPTTVTIPGGVSGVSFVIASNPVSTSENATLTATFGSSTMNTTITLNPYAISNFYATPSSVTGGTSTHGVVQLAGKAGASGDVVSLSSSDPSVSVPATVTVPAGGTGVSFLITTSAVGTATPVTITATLGTSSMQATVTVNP